MAAPLSICTKEEQHSVMCFCGLKECQGPKSIEHFQHNMGTVFCATIMNGLQTKKINRTSVMHAGAGHPSTATTDDNIERVCDMVLLDRRPNINEVANHLQISHVSV